MKSVSNLDQPNVGLDDLSSDSSDDDYFSSKNPFGTVKDSGSQDPPLSPSKRDSLLHPVSKDSFFV